MLPLILMCLKRVKLCGADCCGQLEVNVGFDVSEYPHRRLNALTGEYVLVSPHRAKRPWQGQVETLPPDERPSYDPTCYLCPGNTRSSGVTNADYSNTFVFANDFAALLPETPDGESDSALFQLEAVRGMARVICFSPRHDLSLPEMALPDIRRVIDVWAEQISELGQTYRWVQVFENKGAVMGSSMPHPHGQIWALDTLPNEPFKEDKQQRAYWSENGRSLLVDYAHQEDKKQERIVVENEHWLAVVPFWAFWPFETLLMPRRHILRLPELTDDERNSLAGVLKRLLIKYDNLFETSFPYSMGWHSAPFGDYKYWQLHAHFYPPLLRSATVKKFRVGFEMLGESQRDLTAEQAAERLRGLLEVHYKTRDG
jgi:UDPglucose--hexose-1-phosphate uridylyltransferase